jgi:hypothetical protein
VSDRVSRRTLRIEVWQEGRCGQVGELFACTDQVLGTAGRGRGHWTAGSSTGHGLPSVWMQKVAEEVGVALITTALLGFTVDRALKVELVRDVFNVAFRYVVPTELKEEVLRVLSYRFICDRHLLVIIEPLSDQFVRVTSKVQRRAGNYVKRNYGKVNE